MATCSKCGGDVAERAAFCLNCGSSAHASGRRPIWTWVGLTAIVLAVAGLGWSVITQGYLASRQSDDPLKVRVSAGSSGALVAVPGQSQAPAVGLQGSDEGGPVLSERLELPPPSARVVKGRMPGEISAWLDHLVRVHNRLRGINRSETEAKRRMAASLAPGEFPEDQRAEAAADDARRKETAAEAILDSSRRLESLVADFRSYPPPLECRPIGDQYDSSLRSMLELLRSLQEVLAKSDLDGALSLQGKSRAVERGISNSNRLIERLCERYGVANDWVLVEDTDFGSGFLGVSDADVLKEYERMLKGLLEDGGG